MTGQKNCGLVIDNELAREYTVYKKNDKIRKSRKNCMQKEDNMTHKYNRFAESIAVEFEEPKRTSFVQLTTKDGVPFGCGGCELPPHSSNQYHVHEADEVIHVTEGELEFVFPSGSVTLAARDVIYIPAGEYHQIFNRTDEIAYHTYVFSDPKCTDLIIARYNADKL